MILYIEQQAKVYAQTDYLISMFPHAQIVWIKHYKNLFDKHIPYGTEQCILIARLTWKALLPVPPNYGYGDHAYFLRTQLNCVFDCQYCYLKGAFRNNFPVYFVNYDEIKEQILQEIAHVRASGYEGTIWFYPSNRTDLVGSERFSRFHQTFLPFFASIDGVMIESRTKSATMQPLLDLWSVPVHTELAFTVNAPEIIQQFERGTPPLDKRICAINQMLDAGRQVGLRLMPLLPVDNYLTVYEQFFVYLLQHIETTRCSSIFFGGFVLTVRDYKQMQKKQPHSALWPLIKTSDAPLVRTWEQERKELYELIRTYFPAAQVSMDEM